MVEIRRLSPDELDNFLSFMEGPAFETNPKWSGCYCQFYLNSDAENQTKDLNRKRACDRIKSGQMNGYLAFEGDEVIGWVAANKANNFVQLPPTSETAARILCFIVEKEHQGKGIATALLDFACKDLKAQGFTTIEAAPVAAEDFDASGYRGKLSTFIKAGFSEVMAIDERHVLVHRELTD